MLNFNNINNIASLAEKVNRAQSNILNAVADTCDEGRKWRRSAIKNGVNKYNDPEYAEACRTDARRNLVIWSR